MSDAFIEAIVTEIKHYSLVKDYGWHVSAKNSPNLKEYDVLPVVEVCPSKKNNVKVFSFCGVQIENSYDCFLISQQDLSSNFTNFADDFTTGIVTTFMPQPQSMADAGSWQVRVNPKYDYNREAYPKSYRVTCVEIVVFHLV